MIILADIIICCLFIPLVAFIAVAIAIEKPQRGMTPAQWEAAISYRRTSMKIRHIHLRLENGRDYARQRQAARAVLVSTLRLQASTVRLQRCLEAHA